tara:strand:+ start:367 stop:1134 length:768 start_codon:yes stop_codon:yes gene_type:complete
MNNSLKYVIGGSLAVSALALIISAPKTAGNLKPLENQRMQESDLFSIFTDKETGDMYGYIDGPGGETRFVKMDKNSENKIREERLKEENESNAPVDVSLKEEIFSFDDKWKDYEVNTFIKYRSREGTLLYRLAIQAPVKTINKGQSIDCRFSSEKEKELENLAANQDNSVRLRFKDKDDFWISDFIIPLGTPAAENFMTTSIDAYSRDDCDKKNKLVYHGILNGISFPDFSLVKDGKLLFKGVKLTDPDDDKKAN